ncbi:MAG: type II secretion system protein GspE [Candidatus Hydrothermota bacterium]|nr:MAG: type II secretion system protein GspE [Candidatus Hydrothermae bacterium]
MNGKRTVDMLVRAKLLTPEQAQLVLTEHQRTKTDVTTIITRLGIATEDDIVKALGQIYKIPVIDPTTEKIDENVLKYIPVDVARKYKIFPISKRGRVLTIAMTDPTNYNIIDNLKFITGFEIEPVLATETSIMRAIDQYYGAEDRLKELLESVKEAESGIEVVEEEEEAGPETAAALIEEAPVVRLVNGLIIEAVKRRASDIHIEPYEKYVRVRYRIDGVLHEIMPIPYRLKDAVVSRIKVMSRLDIAERRLPQDGHIKMKLPDGRKIDLRVSTLPTLFGEKVVMRILDKSNLRLDLAKLGMEKEALEVFLEAIERPYGIILVTGPTGSGKTTTLYSAISKLNKPEVNIMTAEDPVEYDFPGINQVQIREDIGLTFAAALRAFLRQDPDIILVGEIRDTETAEIAIRAALTGHLVLSTLHTNDAPSTISRLIDMGIPPYLVAASLNLIVAQRLVKVICPNCKTPYHPTKEDLLKLGITQEEFAGATVYYGRGCNMCNNTGYRGRTGVYEVMKITPEIREMILRNEPIHKIKQKAIEQGMITLREAAIRKLLAGKTTISEVLKATVED